MSRLAHALCSNCGTEMKDEEMRMSQRMNAMFAEDVHLQIESTPQPGDELDHEHLCYKCFYE